MVAPEIEYGVAQLGYPDHMQHREPWAMEKWMITVKNNKTKPHDILQNNLDGLESDFYSLL